MSEDVVINAPGLPSFSFSPEEIANIKASIGAREPDDITQDLLVGELRPRRRGRPPGSKNKTTVEQQPVSETGVIPPAPLTKREEREVAKRLANVLQGATGMAGMIKPYLPMTDDEANAIAEPLASYLIRNEPTNGVAREILENYDILAMVMGVGAYGVRVYNDRRTELAEQKPANTTAIQRVSDIQSGVNGREPDEGTRPLVSVPDASRSGSAPFDL